MAMRNRALADRSRHPAHDRRQANAVCEIAWNKDPALEVICIQSGPQG